MASIPVTQLNDDRSIPQLGLGVFRVASEKTEALVANAFDLGYRHIDTARIYDNEEGVGRAIARSGIARDELFVTTKLWNTDQGAQTVFDAFERSLDRLGLEYVDLYLIHWPSPARDRYVESWRAFEQLRESGRARSIGVCNFLVSHLERLLSETGVVPAVNQIELHPYHQQPLVTEFCREQNIQIESWGPLGQGKYNLLELPEITGPAAAHGKSSAQVVIRWHLQKGHVIFPKSNHRERLAENMAVFDFELSANEMAEIDNLERAGRVGRDPNAVD